MKVNIETEEDADILAQHITNISNFPYEVALKSIKEHFLGKGIMELESLGDILAKEMSSYEMNRLYKEGQIEPTIGEDGTVFFTPTDKFNKEDYNPEDLFSA